MYGRCFPRKNKMEYRRREVLSERLQQAGVPTGPGVYAFESPDGIVVYIGMAGVWHQNGPCHDRIGKSPTGTGFAAQGICHRIKNKQCKMHRQNFLRAMMKKNAWEVLVIRWRELDSKDVSILPAKLEADLLQAHFTDYGQRLPEWNSRFWLLLRTMIDEENAVGFMRETSARQGDGQSPYYGHFTHGLLTVALAR